MMETVKAIKPTHHLRKGPITGGRIGIERNFIFSNAQSYPSPQIQVRTRTLNAGTFAGLPLAPYKMSWKSYRSVPIILYLALSFPGFAQLPDTIRVHKGRSIGTAIGGGTIIAGTLISLNTAWYSQYERNAFHFFDDGREWQQLDKIGHGFSTYTVGKWGHGLVRWCGVSERTSVWVGGTLGFTYLTAVEIMDGHSAEWGFSWWDMAANATGTGLFVGQQLAWKEQRITIKYSAHLTEYAMQRPNVLGEGLSERILKDYNGATYWLSANPRAFGWKALPKWLSVAVGYGGEGMLYANANPGQARQFYLSPDIDLERIPTKSKFLRTLLFTLNCVKVPMPALEFRSNGAFRGHWLYF